MRKNPLIVLAAVTAISVAAAGYLLNARQAAVITQLEDGAPLFPQLVDGVNAVTEVEIRNTDGTITARLTDDTWQIVEKSGYPAKIDKMRELILGIAKARILEERTSKPELYTRLQVEDIDSPDAKSGQVIMRDANGNQVAGLIIGKRRLRGQFAAGTDDLYVRRVGEAQSVLANDIPSVLGGLNQWLERDLVNVPRARIRAVTNTRPEGDLLSVSRAGVDAADVTVDDLPPGKKADQFRANDMANALEFLILDDVLPAEEIVSRPAEGFARFETFDGLIIDVAVHTRPGAGGEDERWIVLDAGFNPDGVSGSPPPPATAGDSQPTESILKDAEAVKQEAQEAAARFRGWAYKLPDWKTDVFLRRQADLIDQEASS